MQLPKLSAKLSAKRMIGGTAVALALGTASVALAFSPDAYTLFDGAHYVSPGHNSARAVQLVSDASTTDSGIDYAVGSTTTTFADLTNLSTDYEFLAGSCGGGSPRFQLNVASSSGDTGNIFVYFGSSPNFNDCVTGTWANTGNLLSGSTTVDTSQLSGGTFYDSYSDALAKYGDYEVSGVQLVADGGWAFPSTGQTVNIDNTMINDTTYTYEEATTTPPTSTTPTSKDQCKSGGYVNYTDQDGNAFKNQGQCVSFVELQNRKNNR